MPLVQHVPMQPGGRLRTTPSHPIGAPASCQNQKGRALEAVVGQSAPKVPLVAALVAPSIAHDALVCSIGCSFFPIQRADGSTT